MSIAPNINVWTLGRGARGQWKLQLSTANLKEAETCFAELEQQGKQVALYELGVFEHEGSRVAGQVGFWWSANLNEYMETEPQGRGVGWAHDFDTYVSYAFPEPMVDRPMVVPVEYSSAVSAKPNAASGRQQDEVWTKDLGPYTAGATQVRRRSTFWMWFVLPGKLFAWFQYMFPGRGQVWASSRRYGNPLVEMLYAGCFWVALAFVLFVWLANGRK